jgi:hypothetical protein
MRYLVITTLSLIILTGCGKGGGGGTNTPVPQPGKLTLLSPAQNELCTQGSVISTSQSTVTLKWVAVDNTGSYEVSIKNLVDGTSATQTTSGTQTSLTLKRNTPYSWSVISNSAANAALAKSETWKFYNSGPASVSYAPFPAEIISPMINQTVAVDNGKVSLSWNATDVDNDILNYDVYFGETPQPDLTRSAITAKTLEENVTSGKLYYWKIVTRDSKGNTSDSGTFPFMTK